MLLPLTAYAVNMSIDSFVEISNAPANSKWQTECGPSTGNYNITKQFTMTPGVNRVPTSSIFIASGNFFCRTSFVQSYGQSPFSSELSITVTVPSLSAPALTVIP
jgi:hypothetical protein